MRDIKKPYIKPVRPPYINAEGMSFSRDYAPVPPHSEKDYRRDETAVQLYGWHPVFEACRNPKRNFRRLFATENAQAKLVDHGVKLPNDVITVHPRIIDHMVAVDAVHQGLYLECDPLPSPSLERLAAEGIVLVLDQVTDPHNVGAILRTATAFDVKALITTNRHSPEATGVLAKAASGALEHIPIISVQNLNRALETLQQRGFQCVGLDSEAENDLMKEQLNLPLALVLGAEGKGLRSSTRDNCDLLARLDLPGKIKSLNVSNAAALALMAVHLKAK